MLALTACGGGGDSSPTPVPSATTGVGVYALVQGNNQPAPFSAGTTEGGCPRTIESGSLTLSADGTYSFSLTTHAVCPQPNGGSDTVTSTVLETGTWSLDGSRLTLQHGSGSDLHASSATRSGGSVTVTVQYEWAGQVPAVTLLLRS